MTTFSTMNDDLHRKDVGEILMEETVICRICLEPIFNFICINCLKKSFSSWLAAKNQKLINEFQVFHDNLLKIFSSDQNQEFCIKCKQMVDAVLCSYCYAKETFWWIFSKDVKLSNKFAKMFNFDFLGTGYMPTIKTRNLEPIIIVNKKEKSDMNICENCGQASSDLREVNGSWLCETCQES